MRNSRKTSLFSLFQIFVIKRFCHVFTYSFKTTGPIWKIQKLFCKPYYGLQKVFYKYCRNYNRFGINCGKPLVFQKSAKSWWRHSSRTHVWIFKISTPKCVSLFPLFFMFYQRFSNLNGFWVIGEKRHFARFFKFLNGQ